MGSLFNISSNSTNTRLESLLEAPTMKGKVIKPFLKDEITHFIHSLTLNDHQTQEPFYVLDLTVVSKLMDTWTQSLPGVRPFYAVKCNPDPTFLAAMAQLGSGFDCASRAEIESVLALGVNPNRIVFANPCKPESHIEFAASVGVDLTTFDSVNEVEKIREFHPKSSLLLRIKSPEDGGADWPLDSKYGALPEEVEPLLRAAQSARLPVIGVAFHIGSGASNTRAYGSAIEAARAVFDTAARLGMAPMTVLDIGGGFVAGSKFEEAASAVRKALTAHFSDVQVSLIAEPGRFFAEVSFTLAASVIGKRIRGERREYWISDGIYGSLMSSVVLEKSNLTCLVVACKSNAENLGCEGAEVYSSTVFGPTCDALDTLVKGQRLPELEVNDWLLFPNMGSYSSALKSTFNGFHTQPYSTYLTYSK